eukprot:4709257-Prymnesium_polylepis.1
MAAANMCTASCVGATGGCLHAARPLGWPGLAAHERERARAPGMDRGMQGQREHTVLATMTCLCGRVHGS